MDLAIAHLQTTLEEYACGNIAPMPIAIALVDGLWFVDIHVRLPEIEYTIEAFDTKISKALRNAAQGFTNRTQPIQDQSWPPDVQIRAAGSNREKDPKPRAIRDPDLRSEAGRI